MALIYIGFSLLLLWANTAGLTVIAGRWIPVFPLARAVGVLLICMAFLFLEHFIGLGRLAWLSPFTTLISVVLLWKKRDALKERGFWRSEAVFLLAFIYAFLWRYAFPDIAKSGEQLADLYFISNYLPGHRLPPPDIWYPPHRFTVYYAFQHYGAALMARILGMDRGVAFHLAACLLSAMTVALAWYFISRFLKNGWHRALLMLVFMSGVTSMSPLVHLAIDQPAQMDAAWATSERVIAAHRFIGDGELVNENRIYTPLGKFMFPPMQEKDKPTPDFQPRQLPSECFGYQYFLGDYHPPLSGFFLLMLALALIAAMETGAIGSIGQGLLALTVPVLLIASPWVFPLQGFLVAAWIGLRLWQKKPPDWRMLAGGFALGALLIFPFLTYLAIGSASSPIRLVHPTDHTPWTRFLGQHWVLMGLIVLAMIRPSDRKLSVSLALAFGLLLLVSEMFFVDNSVEGVYERTNTTMKWWGWIWTGGLVALGTLCLASPARFVRWTAALMLASIGLCVIDLGRYVYYNDWSSMGHLEGSYWYTRDRTNRELFDYLKAAPDGIVLESQYDTRYTEGGIHALFNGKVSAIGWPEHLDTWRAPADDIWTMYEQTKQFYSGALSNNLDWLLAHDVRYVVWMPLDNEKNSAAFERVGQQIGNRYAWQGFSDPGSPPVGVWVRKP